MKQTKNWLIVEKNNILTTYIVLNSTKTAFILITYYEVDGTLFDMVAWSRFAHCFYVIVRR